MTIKSFVITPGVKNHKTNKKKIKNNKIVSLAKTKLNTIEVLTSKVLKDLSICHDEFVSVNNVLKEYHDKKNSKILIIIKNKNKLNIKQCCCLA